MNHFGISFIVFFLLVLPLGYAKIVADIELPFGYLSVKPGDEVYADLKLIDIDSSGERADYMVRVFVIDESGKVILSLDKTIAINDRTDTVIHLALPYDTKPGRYILKVNVDGAETSTNFIVENAEKQPVKSKSFNWFLWLVFIVLISFIVIIFYYNRKLNKLLKHNKKISMEDFIKI